LKPCLVREATVSSTKCGNSAHLTTLSLQSKQLQADYVSSHELSSIIFDYIGEYIINLYPSVKQEVKLTFLR